MSRPPGPARSRSPELMSRGPKPWGPDSAGWSTPMSSWPGPETLSPKCSPTSWRASATSTETSRCGRHRGETDGSDWLTRVQLAVDSEGRAGMLAARSHDVIPVTRPPLAAGALADLELGRLRLPGLRRLEFAWAGDHGAL